MELTAAAQWLNEFFGGFDHSILQFYHNLAEVADPFVRPLMEFLSIIGDNGYFCFALALILCLFKKTRRAGVTIVFAVGIGALITNITLKELIARPRPFVSEYTEWWHFVGAPAEGEFSFPSGHVTAAMSGMTALSICFFRRFKWIVAPAAVYVILMGAARNYLMVHYPSDVLAAMLVGAVAGTAAFFLIAFVFRFFEKHRNVRLFAFGLDFDLIDLFRKKKKTTE